MNLLELRQQFRLVSGQHGLVAADGTDNGANFYINAGQRHLDRMDTTQKSPAVAFRWLNIDFYAVSFQYCRAVKEVWISTITARWQLEKKPLQDMIATYFTTLPSGIDSGAPGYYAPMVTRASPEMFDAPADDADFEGFAGYIDVMSADHFAYNAVLIAPPANEKMMVEVKGLFYTYPLVGDEDESYWSVVHPDVLIMSTLRSIEIMNRNTQGVKDMDVAIAAATIGIGKDLVEEEIAEITQIEG
jgi:hypothetical protein